MANYRKIDLGDIAMAMLSFALAGITMCSNDDEDDDSASVDRNFFY